MYNEAISGLGVIASIIVAYHTAKYAFNSEIKKSKSLLMSACIRFYSATISCIENGMIKNDKITKEIYISELKDIKKIIELFLGSQYYSESYLQIPEASIIATQLNHEIYYHEKVEKELKLNQRTIEFFGKMYEKLISKKLRNEDNFIKELNTIKSAFDKKIIANHSIE